MEKSIKNKSFIKILKPIHKNHTKKAYKRLIKKMYSLKQSLKTRSKKANVKCDITINEIKNMFKDNYGKKCKYCNKTLIVRNIACDHIIPLHNGGDSTYTNLQLICRTCNTRKGYLTDKEYKRLLSILSKCNKTIREYVLRKLSKGGKY